MSSTWEYNNKYNGIIKKIFSTKINSNPVKYNWIVVLSDNLHVKLDDESLDKLNLNEFEKNILLEAKANSKNLRDKISKTYFEYF